MVIADDLTGGADAGVHFAERGLRTLMVPVGEGGIRALPGTRSLPETEILVINTDSRALPATAAFRICADLMAVLNRGPLPIVYKKIDSTLRGSIGTEIEALLTQTALPFCLLAPSYPEQGRTLEGGILMVGRKRKPLALTETARDATFPVHESDLCRLLAGQTSLPVGRTDLSDVAAGEERFSERVRERIAEGCRIIACDAASRQDLRTIAGAAFSMQMRPLFAGSSGLAGEVARILAPGKTDAPKGPTKQFRHILIVSGSASSVTHAQIDRLQAEGIPAAELPRGLVAGDGRAAAGDRKRVIDHLGSALARGCAILRTFEERGAAPDDGANPIPRRIAGLMGAIAIDILRESGVDRDDLALVLIGGDTALAVLQSLDYGGIALEGEMQAGVVRGTLRDGPWDGLTLVTKAGAFGREDALQRIVEKLTGA